MSSYKGLLLTSKGEVKNANVNIMSDKLTINDIQKYLRRKEFPQKIAEYRNNEKTYLLWGYFEDMISGKKGNENQSKFPMKSQSIIVRENKSPIIGDILLISYLENIENTLPITPLEWNDFVEHGHKIMIGVNNTSKNEVIKPSKKSQSVKNVKTEKDKVVDEAKGVAKNIAKNVIKNKSVKFTKGGKPEKEADNEIQNNDLEDSKSDNQSETTEEEEDKDKDDDVIEDDNNDCDDNETDKEESDCEDKSTEDKDDFEEELDNQYFVEDLEEEREIQSRRKKKLSKNNDLVCLKDELTKDTPLDKIAARVYFINTFEPIFETTFGDSKLARLLEKEIFEYVLEQAINKFVPRNWKSKIFQGLYSQSIQRIFWNLHPDSPIYNQSLIRRILEKEFPITQIVHMTSYDLCPEKWRSMADKQLLREQKILEGDKSRSTDQFKCHRCGKRECSFYELQTRSADEPMTQFITCLNCGKRWRQ